MKRLLPYAAWCCLAMTACRQPPLPEPPPARPVRAECPQATSDTYFFPPGDLGSFNPSWDLTPSRILAAMRAPTLSSGQEQLSEVYRLIAVPGSNSRPIAVSATLQNSAWSVRGVEFQHSNDLTPTIDRTRMLSTKEAVTLAQAIRKSKFWNSGPEVGSPNIVVLDGGTWILEARRDRSYHIVSGPWELEEPFRTLGEMLVTLAGLPHSLLPEPSGSRLPPIQPPGGR